MFRRQAHQARVLLVASLSSLTLLFALWVSVPDRVGAVEFRSVTGHGVSFSTSASAVAVPEFSRALRRQSPKLNRSAQGQSNKKTCSLYIPLGADSCSTQGNAGPCSALGDKHRCSVHEQAGAGATGVGRCSVDGDKKANCSAGLFGGAGGSFCSVSRVTGSSGTGECSAELSGSAEGWCSATGGNNCSVNGGGSQPLDSCSTYGSGTENSCSARNEGSSSGASGCSVLQVNGGGASCSAFASETFCSSQGASEGATACSVVAPAGVSGGSCSAKAVESQCSSQGASGGQASVCSSLGPGRSSCSADATSTQCSAWGGFESSCSSINSESASQCSALHAGGSECSSYGAKSRCSTWTSGECSATEFSTCSAIEEGASCSVHNGKANCSAFSSALQGGCCSAMAKNTTCSVDGKNTGTGGGAKCTTSELNVCSLKNGLSTSEATCSVFNPAEGNPLHGTKCPPQEVD